MFKVFHYNWRSRWSLSIQFSVMLVLKLSYDKRRVLSSQSDSVPRSVAFFNSDCIMPTTSVLSSDLLLNVSSLDIYRGWNKRAFLVPCVTISDVQHVLVLNYQFLFQIFYIWCRLFDVKDDDKAYWELEKALEILNIDHTVCYNALCQGGLLSLGTMPYALI